LLNARRLQYRGHDPRVIAATTQVGIEFETYFRFGEICTAPIYKGNGTHHYAGDAVATLTCLQANKGLLNRVERAVWRRQTFHRGDWFGYVSYPDRA
jgi:hypothetical protein